MWRGWKVAPRYPPPRCALRFAEQVAWFRSQLPGHVLVIQMGTVWKVDQAKASRSDEARIRRRSTAEAQRLWASGIAVAWIEETGRRPGVIAERRLVSRWSGRAVPVADAARRESV